MRAVATLVGITCLLLIPERGGAQRKGHPEKFDTALQQIVKQGPSGPVRLIIRANAAARRTLAATLTNHGDRIEADHPSIDAMTATVHGEDLAALADDPAIDRLSIDARVETFQTMTGTNSLLATELLPVSGLDGTSVGVAVIDSGVQSGGDLAS